MSEINTRKPVFQDYYTEEDYEEVLAKLPDIVKEAERKSLEVLEPTIYEKRKVMAFVKEFVKNKNRKIYGGTALNELLKAKNPTDAIYDEYDFADIEFYSPTPVPDLVELCNALYEKGYKYVQGIEGQHEETYKLFVNFDDYCDITYCPTRIYNGIKTIPINEINYTDPHFMWIDYLRMFNDPMTSSWRWEKAFKRVYLLLKDYPPEHYDKHLSISKPSDEILGYFVRIKQEFMMKPEIQENTLLSGFDAYNFFIRHAAKDKNVEQMTRTHFGKNKIASLVTNVPFIDLVSVNYSETVLQLYSFIKNIVGNPSELTVEEYFPLFQFVNYSIVIKYKEQPIVRVTDANNVCIPFIKVTTGVKYVTYTYILMSMLINRFRSHLDKNKEMYFNYGIAISNLIKARNVYLDENKLSAIDNSIFSEFRTNCTGFAISPSRLSRLRRKERLEQGKRPGFSYVPEEFFKSNEESQAKFDPKKSHFRNTSGNKILKPEHTKFKFDDNKNLVENKEIEESDDEKGEEENRE